MDKNKSAYKLKNLPPIYYINLDGQPDRVEYMEDQFKYWEIKNYTRISGYDGREDDLGDIIKGVYPSMMTSGEARVSLANNQKLRKTFGWEPSMKVEEWVKNNGQKN